MKFQIFEIYSYAALAAVFVYVRVLLKLDVTYVKLFIDASL